MTHLEKVCFVEECAGSVIMPVMKIEMNDWTPATGPLENCLPVKNAIAYSTQSDPPEVMLLPFLIGKYPYDTILWWVNQVWDPMSCKQTQSLVQLLDSSIFRSMPWATANDEKLRALFNSINERLLRTRSDNLIAYNCTNITIWFSVNFTCQYKLEKVGSTLMWALKNPQLTVVLRRFFSHNRFSSQSEIFRLGVRFFMFCTEILI